MGGAGDMICVRKGDGARGECQWFCPSSGQGRREGTGRWDGGKALITYAYLARGVLTATSTPVR